MVLAPVNRLQSTQIVDVHVQMLDEMRRALCGRVSACAFTSAPRRFWRACACWNQQATIKPGRQWFAQLRFEAPVVGVLGDRFVIRSYSPQRTIGGGMILDAFATRHRAREFDNRARTADEPLSTGRRNRSWPRLSQTQRSVA